MHRKLSPAALAGGVIGVLLFVYALRAAGTQTVLEGVRRTGVAFIWILALSAIRYVVRCFAWRLCVEDRSQLTFTEAFVAFVAGDAVGNLTFFGPVASEGTKAVVVRGPISGMSALSSIALENIFYALSVAGMILLGSALFTSAFQMNPLMQWITAGSAAAAITLAAVTLLLLYRSPRVVTRLVEWLVQRTELFGLRHRLDKIRELEDRIHRFAAAYPARVPQVLLFEVSFHALAVAEIYVLLLVLEGGAPGTLLLQSIVLETINRLITVAFKFIPMRVGVDEAGSGLATQALTMTSSVGVTMAIVRKARTLLWSAVGVALLLRRGLFR